MVMLPNIDNLNLPDLHVLQVNVENRIGEIEKKQVDRLREKFKKETEAQGISFDLVIGKIRARKRASAKRARAEPKYQNPRNSKDQWSGRGRKPKWVDAALKSGKKMDDLLIKKDAA